MYIRTVTLHNISRIGDSTNYGLLSKRNFSVHHVLLLLEEISNLSNSVTFYKFMSNTNARYFLNLFFFRKCSALFHKFKIDQRIFFSYFKSAVARGNRGRCYQIFGTQNEKFRLATDTSYPPYSIEVQFILKSESHLYFTLSGLVKLFRKI